MRRILKAVSIFAAIFGMLLSFVLVGCGGPNEKQLQALEETKAAAASAESSQADCEAEKSDLQGQLASKKQKLEEVKQEKIDVSARLRAMSN